MAWIGKNAAGQGKRVSLSFLFSLLFACFGGKRREGKIRIWWMNILIRFGVKDEG